VLSLCSNLAFEFVGSWIGFPASTFFCYGKCMIFVEAYGHWPQVFRFPVLSLYFPELRSMSIVLVLVLNESEPVLRVQPGFDNFIQRLVNS